MRQQGIQEVNRLEANQQAAQLQALAATILGGEKLGSQMSNLAMGDYSKTSTPDLNTMLQILQGSTGAQMNILQGRRIPTRGGGYLREPLYGLRPAQTGSAYAV